MPPPALRTFWAEVVVVVVVDCVFMVCVQVVHETKSRWVLPILRIGLNLQLGLQLALSPLSFSGLQPDPGLNMPPKKECAMCGRCIADLALGITVDTSEYWEAAEAKQTLANIGKPPKCRGDGRTDLLVCTECYNDYKVAESAQYEEEKPDDEGENPDDEGEKPDSNDADLAEALRLSRSDLDVPRQDTGREHTELAEALHLSLLDLDVPRQDTGREREHAELAEAIRLSLLDGGDAASSQSFAASSQSFTASCLPRDKSSESDEEEWHLLSKLEVPQKDLDADVG